MSFLLNTTAVVTTARHTLEPHRSAIARSTESAHAYYTVIHNYRTPSFQRHNLVNVRFISIKISTSEREIMLCEVLSEFPQYVLPLPCNVNVTSERRQGDGVTVS